MSKRITLFSILVLLGLSSVAAPVQGQALVPYTLQLNASDMEKQGVFLTQEAVQLARLQQFDLAKQRVELATQLAPKHAPSWFLLGSLYVQTEEVDKGIVALQKAHSLDPKEPGVLFSLGSARFQKGDYKGAIADLETGLKIKPDAPDALFDLGNAYYMLNRYPDAIAQYQKAVDKDAKFWPAINNIGLIEYEQGNVNGAIGQWQKASDLDDKAAEPRLATAVALYARGEEEKGLTLGEAAIALDSRYADLEFLKENLWGDRLLGETKKFLEIPRIQASIVKSQDQPSPETSPSE